MSYVLEALKRADAQRERGAVPDLHAQPAALPAAQAVEPAAAPVPWIAAGLGVLLLAGLGWWWSRPPAEPQNPPALASAPATPAPPAVLPVAPAPVEPLRVVPKPAPAPAPVAKAPPAAAPAAPPALPAAPPDAATAAVTPTGPGTGTAAPAADTRLPKLAELPQALRSTLPPLAVGGSVYSTQPAQRLLILNGQVLREGDRAGPELTLEQIRPKSAVLRLRQQRFELPF